ncbi:AAA domain-containing protein [Xylaria bambusicola]|uniref:AAA domain-containing protein n=1 Tax=Xylaria bambusicola TaxID=326684 RepID=UPI002008CF94|nr:AAA domain-containing protein [Xylaria bambusicola]KAI0517331.1 AAA domain-containing protein [Xylaria bambusicola]
MPPSLPNIYIIGSQCTGKTTLVNALCEYFQHHPIASAKSPTAIKEVARSVLEAHGFDRGDIRNSQDRALELQRLIIEAQSKAERSQLETGSWFISDRSAVDPIIYARKYVSEKAATALASSPQWLEMSHRMAKSLVIVCEAGVDWLTDDGVRLMPLDTTEWQQTHAEFCAVLDGVGLIYHVLPARIKDMDERVQFVLTRWKEMATAHGEL